MPLKFGQERINDNSVPNIIEDAFRAYAAFAGIHSFKFDDTYSPKPTGWVSDPGSSAAIVSKTGVWNREDERWNDENTGWLSGIGPIAPLSKSAMWNDQSGTWDDERIIWL